MNNINKEPKTLNRWKEILMPREIETLHYYGCTAPEEALTPG